jgi:hypothetical protein
MPSQNGSFVYVNYPVAGDDGDEPREKDAASGFVVTDMTSKPGGKELGSLKAIQEDAERRDVVILTLETGARGDERRETVELPGSATVGELRGIAARQLGVPVGRVALSRGRAEAGTMTAARQFGTDGARLTVDPAGPKLEGSSRTTAVIFACEDATTAVAPGAAASSSASSSHAVLGWGGGDSSSAAATSAEPDSVDLSSLPADLRPPADVAVDPTSLRTWLKSHAEYIMFQSTATYRQVRINMNPFLNQYLETRRFAWLFGRVTQADKSSYAAQGAGKVVTVEAIYEPPQTGFRHKFLMHRDPDQATIELITGSLDLELVGWLFTSPYRGKPENILSSSELLLAAEHQAKHPHFMTVVFTFEQHQDAASGRRKIFRSTTAWQLSEQCIKLHKAGQLYRDPRDEAFVVRSRRSVMASDPEDPTHRVSATTKFHTSYLVSPAGIQAMSDDETMLSSRFPVLNRVTSTGDPLTVTLDDAKKAVFDLRPSRGESASVVTVGTIRDTMLARIADFHFLLWLVKHGNTLTYPVSAAEVTEMCRYIRDHDAEGAATFRFKLLATLGGGWLCPLTEALRGYDDIRDSPRQLRDHIKRTFGADSTPVVDPLYSVKATSRAQREKKFPGLLTRLDMHLGPAHGDEFDSD